MVGGSVVAQNEETNGDTRGSSFEPTAEWFHKLAQSAPFSIVAYRAGRILYANQATAEITGYDIDEILRLDPEDLVEETFFARMVAPDAETGVYPAFRKPVEIPFGARTGRGGGSP